MAGAPEPDDWEEVPPDEIDDWEEVPTAPAPRQKMGPGQAALKGVQDIPTFGFGDELGAGFQDFLTGLAKNVPGAANLMGVDPRYLAEMKMGDVYRQALKENRAESTKAGEDQPVAYYGAGAGASIPVAAVTSPFRAAQGAGLAGRMAAGAGNAAIAGGLTGAGTSEAEDVAGLAGDALRGAAGGAGVGAAFPVAGAALRAAGKPVASGLRRLGINQGRRVLLSGADSLSSRLPTADEAVEEALRSKAIRPFSTTKKSYERLRSLAADQGKKNADIIAELEARGITGPDAVDLAVELERRGVALEPRTMNKALPKEFMDQATEVLNKPQSGSRLTVSQAEDLKRALQKQAKYGRREDTELNNVRKDIASVFRQANEDEVLTQARAQGGRTQSVAEEFVPTKERLGRLIEARDAAKRGAAAAGKRSFFGPLDWMAATGGGIAGGLPGALATGAAVNLARTRLPSAVARGSYGLSEMLRRPAGQGVAAPVASRFVADILREPRVRALTPEEYEALLAEDDQP